jgi:PAS domain S-box-containing protein
MAWRDAVSWCVPAGASPELSIEELLLRRTRTVLWTCLVGAVIFTALEALASPPQIAAPFYIKLVGIVMTGTALLLVRGPWMVEHAKGAAIATVSVAYVTTALPSIISPEREYGTIAVLFVGAALVTATMLPWGLGAQCVTLFVGASVLLVDVYLTDGDFAVVLQDPGAAVAVGFGFSLVMAYEVRRYNRALVNELAARRAAERALSELNAALEQRVEERTAELAAVNDRLEAEVHERRKAAEALRVSQARLFDVVDNSNAIISLKDREGRYLLVNREFERVFELGREQVIGCSDDQLFPASVARILRAGDERVLASDGPRSRDVELPLDTAARVYVSLKFPLHDAQGAVYGVGTILTDITALRHLEEETRQHREELSHVLRLHSMGETAAAMAHEIHQPLGAIANYAQGLLRRMRADTTVPPETIDPVQSIAEEALRAGEILRGIRHLVSLHTAAEELIDANEVVRSAARVVAPQARRAGIRVRTELAQRLPAVEGDAMQLEQVVVNLMLNGIDAIVEGRCLRREITLQTAQNGDGVAISVGDTGTGIAPSVEANLFKPFFTTKARGLGMGLAISRSIVAAHGGWLWVEPGGRSGATFRFSLPAAPPREGLRAAG